MGVESRFEYPFHPGSVEYSIVHLANDLRGTTFPKNDEGLSACMKVLKDQHARVMPKTGRFELRQIVLQRQPIIKVTERMASAALVDGDYAAALMAGNHLFAYGNEDYQDALTGEAFSLSLRFHRQMAELISERFSDEDRFFVMAEERVRQLISNAQANQDPGRELSLTRNLIHNAVLASVLGDEARNSVDPYALIPKETWPQG